MSGNSARFGRETLNDLGTHRSARWRFRMDPASCLQADLLTVDGEARP
jgi:hypothetical protein